MRHELHEFSRIKKKPKGAGNAAALFKRLGSTHLKIPASFAVLFVLSPIRDNSCNSCHAVFFLFPICVQKAIASVLQKTVFSWPAFRMSLIRVNSCLSFPFHVGVKKTIGSILQRAAVRWSSFPLSLIRENSCNSCLSSSFHVRITIRVA